MTNQFNVGDIVEGKVSQVKPFGAFVQLDTKNRGLVHISQVSQNYVKDINDVLSVGDTVKVKILSVEDGNKIALSIKQAMPQEKREEKRAVSSNEFATASASYDNNHSASTGSHLEDLLKEFTRQSNERHADINKRLKR